MKALNGDGLQPYIPPVPLKAKVEGYIAQYQAEVERIGNHVIEYASGRTNLDYARERVQIWQDYAATLA